MTRERQIIGDAEVRILGAIYDAGGERVFRAPGDDAAHAAHVANVELARALARGPSDHCPIVLELVAADDAATQPAARRRRFIAERIEQDALMGPPTDGFMGGEGG